MGKVNEITADSFDKNVLKAGKPVLVDFWATWCGPCKMMAPVVEKVAESTDAMDFYKCDVDQNQSLAMKFGISAVPTLLIFKDGKVADSITGAMPEAAFRSKLAPYIG